MSKSNLIVSLVLLSLLPSSSLAQKVGFAPHIGTLGVGVDLAVALDSRLGVRGGFNVFPVGVSVTSGDIAFDASVSSPQFTAMVDLYIVGGLRVSGGVLLSSDDVTLTANLAEPVEIGENVYNPEDVGTLTGIFSRNTLSPYLGVGFGNAATSKIGFFLDLGVGYHGEVDFKLEADGPIVSDPVFQDDIAQEEQRIQDDVKGYKYYPVLSLGFSIGF